ncbi:Uncharacterised protein [Providencia rustigianii]|nr:Uncharacterised protein [Providencia rustigianii]
MPQLNLEIDKSLSPQQYRDALMTAASADSHFIARDTHTGKACSMEGIVTRDSQGFHVDDFMQHIFKYVRKIMSKRTFTGSEIGSERYWHLNDKGVPDELATNAKSRMVTVGKAI